MKHSIKNKFSFIFISILAGTLLLCLLSNIFFLKSYYIVNKKSDIEDVYVYLNNASIHHTFNDQNFKKSFELLCEIDNVSVIILDKDDSMLISSAESNDYILMDRLINHFKEQSLQYGHNFNFQRSTDSFNNTDYLEMWGVLDNGEKFLIRCAIISVEDNVIISNKFLVYVGLLGMILGTFAILLVTTRITKPILKLTMISARMADLDFDEKYVCGNDNNEIDTLGENINRMSTKLESTIKELKDANEKLLSDIARKDELEKMRKEFTSNVSHELKTPIALIQSYAEGIKEGITDDEESRNYYLDVIIDESNKMNNLVKELMSLSELESGNLNIDIEKFDIIELIENLVLSMEIYSKQKDIFVTFDKNNIDNLYVETDEFKIEEVLRNYISNAINYCKYENKVKIYTEIKEDNVRINVFNTGDSIPYSSLEHLWDKFYKVDKARSREVGGSGIGLSIVKAIMDALECDYGVENLENGVIFYFEVPLSKN